jgi:hypothetical protein
MLSSHMLLVTLMLMTSLLVLACPAMVAGLLRSTDLVMPICQMVVTSTVSSSTHLQFHSTHLQFHRPPNLTDLPPPPDRLAEFSLPRRRPPTTDPYHHCVAAPGSAAANSRHQVTNRPLEHGSTPCAARCSRTIHPTGPNSLLALLPDPSSCSAIPNPTACPIWPSHYAIFLNPPPPLPPILPPAQLDGIEVWNSSTTW